MVTEEKGQTLSLTRQILNDPGIEGNPLKQLKVTEAYWMALKEGKCNGTLSSSNIVTPKKSQKLEQIDFDVCVCGGTLGILVALTLQLKGHKVAVVEKRRIEGRAQEWNSSRKELSTLVNLGLLTKQELEECIATEYNPVRAGFKGGTDVWVNDCLNIGVDPIVFIKHLRRKFVSEGGTVMEDTSFRKAIICDNGVSIQLGKGGSSEPFTVGDVNRSSSDHHLISANNNNNGHNASTSPTTITCRLLLDCMGHYSPIVKQIRGNQTPDGMCLVVGGCFTGVPPSKNQTADLLYTFTDSQNDMQLYWEAFPAHGGTARTAYMFTYADVHPSRPSFERLLDEYFELLPEYQNISLEQLKFKRVLMGGFPCYRKAPLRTQFDRVLQIGDASCYQSPLSFGGFGSMLRHLPRLMHALHQAVQENRLSASDLNWVNAYQPSLSCAWLFQRSMALRPGALQRKTNVNVFGIGDDHINALLKCNFAVMSFWGEWCLKPFLADMIQFVPLFLSMMGMFFTKPLVVMRVFFQVDVRTFFGWFKHFLLLGKYTLLYFLCRPLKNLVMGYKFQRFYEACAWGCGMAR